MNLNFVKLLIASVFFCNLFSVGSSHDIDYNHVNYQLKAKNLSQCKNITIDLNKSPMDNLHCSDEQNHIDSFVNLTRTVSLTRTLANINMPILVLALLQLGEKNPICTMDAKTFKLNLFAYFAISITETFRYLFFPKVFNENYMTAFYFAFSFFLFKVFSNNKLKQAKSIDVDMV